MDWFLYGNGLRQERVKGKLLQDISGLTNLLKNSGKMRSDYKLVEHLIESPLMKSGKLFLNSI